MDHKELEIIEQLMEQLRDEMEYSPEDLEERLGRKKPEVEIVKMEGKLPLDEESEEEMSPLEDDLMSEPQSPEEKLKARLMKLRGK